MREIRLQPLDLVPEGFVFGRLALQVAARQGGLLRQALWRELARAAHEAAGASPNRPCNLAYTLTVLQRITPRLLAIAGEIGTLIEGALTAIARTIKRRKLQRFAPRKHDKVKPHPSAAYKG